MYYKKCDFSQGESHFYNFLIDNGLDGKGDVKSPPTNASVAMLMRTEGGKTVRKATKQAIKVEPVVNK